VGDAEGGGLASAEDDACVVGGCDGSDAGAELAGEEIVPRFKAVVRL
jgi:hypothetical protein